jgi:hypothetical protein
MDRRAVLRSVALALPLSVSGCLSNPPGATGPRQPPKEPEEGPRDEPSRDVRIDQFDFEETDDGLLRVFGTVVNSSDVERVATVKAIVDASGEHFERTTDVTVPANGEAEFGVVVEVEYDTFAKNGRVNVELV